MLPRGVCAWCVCHMRCCHTHSCHTRCCRLCPHCCCRSQGREPLFVPCTPLGCIELLDRTNTPIAGARAVVIGRSNIVGMPVALLLVKRNATVTVCHSATQHMDQVVREADIVIAAAGQAELVKVGSGGVLWVGVVNYITIKIQA